MPDLTAVSTDDLRTLLAAVRLGRVKGAVTATKLAAAGLALDGVRVARALNGVGEAGLAPVLEAVLAERAGQRGGVALAWTGPEPVHASTRDTRAVLEELFQRAQRCVQVVGYTFSHGEKLLGPLHTAMVQREVAVDVFLEIGGEHKGAKPEHAEPVVREKVREFLDGNWPWPERPAFHYDKRRFDPEIFASVHAKCVVVDDERALVTSANFTDRGQTRNIEVGALIEDPTFAANLAGQLRRCLQVGVFKTVPKTWMP